jgi:hypothetical protein
MEDAVYICGWSKSDDGFVFWLDAKPHVRASGATYDEAMEAFLDKIVKHGGAYHAVTEFVPPLPHGDFDRRYSNPEIYSLCGDDRFETGEPRGTWFEPEDERTKREAWYDDFFSTPCCSECRSPLAPRSGLPLTLSYVKGSYDGGFVSFSRATLYVFSEKFLALLSEEERQRLEFRPVIRSKKGRKQFFELIGPSGPPEVAVRGLELGGWRCEVCDTRCFGYWSKDSVIHDFVARSDLPNPLREVFTIGVQPNVHLCVTAERWAKMVGQPGTRGIVSQLIGVVPDEEVVRTPELTTRREQEEQWHAERAAARGE